MKKILVLILLLAVIGCKNQTKEESTLISFKETSEQYHAERDSFFLHLNLRDTLYSFIDYIESFPSSYKYPIGYSLIFDQVKSDTVIIYTIGVEVVATSSPSDNILKGIYQLGSENILIYSGLSSLQEFVNEELLSSYIKENESNSISEEWDYIPPMWEYKLKEGKMELVSKRMPY